MSSDQIIPVPSVAQYSICHMPQPPTAIIHFMGHITDSAISLLLDALNQIQLRNAKHITICLHSGGGEIGAAIVGYNHIRQVGTPIVMHNMSNVDSAAVILYLAANVRSTSPHSSFFLHPGGWRGQNDMNLARARDLVAVAELDTDRYVEIFKERTGGLIDIRAALERDRLRLDADTACSSAITTVRTPVLPPIAADFVHWIRSQ